MNDLVTYLMLLGALGTGTSLPFWAVSNRNALMMERDGAMVQATARTSFDDSKTFQWEWGVSLAANAQGAAEQEGSTLSVRPMVDELYVNARWNVLRLDVGMQHRDREFMGADAALGRDSHLGSLSMSEGHIVESNNTRSMPGYRLVLEPWAVPGTKDHLLISGSYGDYKTLDDRYVRGTLVHRTQAYVRYQVNDRLHMQIGLDHYALWGGDSPRYGKMPVTFGNYFRVVTGGHASSSGTVSDQINVIGDQGGAEHFRIGWSNGGRSVMFQAEKPYNDGSGMGPQNFPDGLYTLHFGHDDKDRWVSDIVLEYLYSMWQSGTRHDRPATEEEKARQDPSHPQYGRVIIGGGDSYFTNGEYLSGWTYYGRSICCPLFFTGDYRGETMRVVNNRIKAFNFALSGKLFKVAPYKLTMTLSDNYGTYRNPYVAPSTWETDWKWWKKNEIDRGVRQFSAAFLVDCPLGTLPVVAMCSLCYDTPGVLEGGFSIMAGLRWDLISHK